MSDSLEVPRALMSVMTSLLSDRPYNDVLYSNLQLYSEDINEAIDPDCIIKPQIFSSYWPGGIPEAGNTFATLIINGSTLPDPTRSIATNREQILGLKLSRRACRRWSDFRLQSGLPSSYDVDDTLPSICAIKEIPLGAVLISEVVEHRKIKAGRRVASLYFPTIVHSPAISLESLQKAQQDTIAEEAL
jgi:hypothetical protein